MIIIMAKLWIPIPIQTDSTVILACRRREVRPCRVAILRMRSKAFATQLRTLIE